ncbi:MAG: type II toxin-antitoxin system VapB family antitoxin [Gemmatimonadaceae bacterium]|jgi:antitoxin VapB|nr:type II toxin-antitoxin system VapB family antitoxin [Gemmatimonadaceae bacterium]
MAISIKDPETDRLVRALVGVTGESLTEAIREAVRERLERARRAQRPSLTERVRRLQVEVSRLPVLDNRTSDAIIGYGADGAPE